MESTTQWQLKLTYANKYIDHICKLAVNTSHVLYCKLYSINNVETDFLSPRSKFEITKER